MSVSQSLEINNNNYPNGLIPAPPSSPLQTHNGRRYSRIEPTIAEKVRNVILNIFTLGFFMIAQTIRLRQAILRDDTETATSALHWGALLGDGPIGMDETDVRNLLAQGKINSVEFLIAQIKYDPDNLYIGDNGGSIFVEVRDDDKNPTVQSLFRQYFGAYRPTYTREINIHQFFPRIGMRISGPVKARFFCY